MKFYFISFVGWAGTGL